MTITPRAGRAASTSSTPSCTTSASASAPRSSIRRLAEHRRVSGDAIIAITTEGDDHGLEPGRRAAIRLPGARGDREVARIASCSARPRREKSSVDAPRRARDIDRATRPHARAKGRRARRRLASRCRRSRTRSARSSACRSSPATSRSASAPRRRCGRCRRASAAPSRTRRSASRWSAPAARRSGRLLAGEPLAVRDHRLLRARAAGDEPRRDHPSRGRRGRSAPLTRAAARGRDPQLPAREALPAQGRRASSGSMHSASTVHDPSGRLLFGDRAGRGHHRAQAGRGAPRAGGRASSSCARQSSSARTPTSSSSPTRPRTTSPSRCAWSRATCSCWRKRYADKLDSDADEFIDFARRRRRADAGADRRPAPVLARRHLRVRDRAGRLHRGRRATLAMLKTAIEERGAEVTVDPLPTVHGRRHPARPAASRT